jgi:hypothetical protein
MCHKLDPRALDPDRLTGYLDYLEGGPLAVTIPPLSVQNPDSYYLGARDAEVEMGAMGGRF